MTSQIAVVGIPILNIVKSGKRQELVSSWQVGYAILLLQFLY